GGRIRGRNVTGVQTCAFPIYKDAKLRLDVLNTVKSAKDVFFPQTEDLASFKTEGKEISIQAENPLDEDFAVFGVRACDVKSFDRSEERRVGKERGGRGWKDHK